MKYEQWSVNINCLQLMSISIFVNRVKREEKRISHVITDNVKLAWFNECLQGIVISTLASFPESHLRQMTKRLESTRREAAVCQLQLHDAQQARIEVRGRKESQRDQHRRRRNEVLTLKGKTRPRGVDYLVTPPSRRFSIVLLIYCGGEDEKEFRTCYEQDAIRSHLFSTR